MPFLFHAYAFVLQMNVEQETPLPPSKLLFQSNRETVRMEMNILSAYVNFIDGIDSCLFTGIWHGHMLLYKKFF